MFSMRWKTRTGNLKVFGVSTLLLVPVWHLMPCHFALSAVFVDDSHAEAARVAERLAAATQTSVTGPQHFWLDMYHDNILATLKDRVWRGAILLERCRAALARTNHYCFLQVPSLEESTP